MVKSKHEEISPVLSYSTGVVTYLQDRESVGGIGVSVLRIDFGGQSVFPSQVLGFLPRRVGVGQEEPDFGSGHEALPGRLTGQGGGGLGGQAGGGGRVGGRGPVLES